MSPNGGSANGSVDALRSGLSGDTVAVSTALIAVHPVAPGVCSRSRGSAGPRSASDTRSVDGSERLAQRLAVFRNVRTDSGTKTARIATPQSAE